ncbi:hypothetical protein BGZ68_000017 [Mortierella alpina]|nr:hypothetical protein BGZ68_000017 [Mortierella alpina]
MVQVLICSFILRTLTIGACLAPAAPRDGSKRTALGNVNLELRYMYTTSGPAITGQNGTVKTPSSRIGFLMEYIFDEDKEVLLTKEGGLDRDKFATRRLDGDELLDAYRVKLLYRVMQDVWRQGQVA